MTRPTTTRRLLPIHRIPKSPAYLRAKVGKQLRPRRRRRGPEPAVDVLDALHESLTRQTMRMTAV